MNELIKQLAEVEHIDENLKEHHQMEWVQAMNNIKIELKKLFLMIFYMYRRNQIWLILEK